MSPKSLSGPSPWFFDEDLGYITAHFSGWPLIPLGEEVGEVGVFCLHRSAAEEMIAKT